MILRISVFSKYNISKRNLCSTAELVRVINDQKYEVDSFTNVPPKIITQINRNLHLKKYHPICLLKERIIKFFYKKFIGRRGNPVFSVYDSLNPVVSVHQNFDSLLVPSDHPSRSKTDCYYLNKHWMLRGHMTAHQSDLIKTGLDNFLMVGDVFRRDEIDSTHYPIFHQLDAVRLLTSAEAEGDTSKTIKDDHNHCRNKEKQEVYTTDATKIVEAELKSTLEELTKDLFGPKIQYKWVEAFFPFTHPSWELEVLFKDKWVEMLGCGIMEHKILENGGCEDKIGWAFGLGLERLAMLYYSIPDIRLFWTTDPGFHHQFEGKTCTDKFKYKPFSVFPACPFDISFWTTGHFEPNDFYEVAREFSQDNIEQVKLIDRYECKKTQRVSYCFRVVYRSMVKTFTKEELRELHAQLEKKVVELFNVVIR